MHLNRASVARTFLDFVTGWPLHIATAVFVIAVLVIAPRQVGLLAYKASLLLIAAVGAYWIDRAVFHRRAGVGDTQDQWQLVVLIAAAMLAAGLAA